MKCSQPMPIDTVHTNNDLKLFDTALCIADPAFTMQTPEVSSTVMIKAQVGTRVASRRLLSICLNANTVFSTSPKGQNMTFPLSSTISEQGALLKIKSKIMYIPSPVTPSTPAISMGSQLWVDVNRSSRIICPAANSCPVAIRITPHSVVGVLFSVSYYLLDLGLTLAQRMEDMPTITKPPMSKRIATQCCQKNFRRKQTKERKKDQNRTIPLSIWQTPAAVIVRPTRFVVVKMTSQIPGRVNNNLRLRLGAGSEFSDCQALLILRTIKANKKHSGFPTNIVALY
eukprot:TRINITY_DN2355_c0_g1_i1.p2 TRINITY_DN2355_c0_g1~~TRINITY_DN2355_c0_g1_i1.p2  ORF type:complete len:285 (-),score=6.49 TRINITY_DN2355_c0_g1_i1:464-1318(-)